MTSRIIVGTEECPTRWIFRIIKSSKSFHLLHEKWPSVARDLEIKEEDIKKLRKNMLLEKDELSDIVHEVISVWVGKEGSGATLDKLFASLHSNELGSIADLIKDEFTLKCSRWDVPSYYISRTLISRNVLDKNKFMEELQSTNDIFIFTGISMSRLSNIFKSKMVENSTTIVQDARINHNYIRLDFPTHFSKICKKASVPVHLIKFEQNGDKWIHVQSSRNLPAMREMIDKSQTHLDETDLIRSLKTETYPVCISDTPGMGKSTLLQHIGQQLSKIENNRKVLFATMNEIVAVFMQNDASDAAQRKALLELILNKLFCSNVGQTSSLSLKLNSKNLEIELLLDGLDEVTSSRMSVALDLLKYLSTTPSIRVWVATRPHLLQQLEDCLNIFGYNIQAFTKQNQISFLKDFWLSRSKNLVTDRLKQFAETCLTELNSKMSKKDGDIAGIPLQCLLVGEVYEEQAHEHSVATNPNETWIIHINSLVELYQRLIEKQYAKYKVTSSGNLLTEERLYRQHIRLAVQLIFPELLEELPVSFKKEVNLNELLRVGLLEKSSTVLEPKFVHRTIGEFLIAKFLLQLLNFRADGGPLNCISQFLNIVLVCKETRAITECINFNYITNYFVNNEICHFFDTLLAECDKALFCLDTHLNFNRLEACVYGDYFNLFKNILLQWRPTSAQGIFDDNLLYLAIRYSGIGFLKVILENNPTLLEDPETKTRSVYLSIHFRKSAQLRYLLNVSDVRELMTHPVDKTKYVIHKFVAYSAIESISTVKQTVEILDILLDINSDLLEQLDEEGRTPIMCGSIHPEVVRKLVERNANVFVKDKDHNTVLHDVFYSEFDVALEELPTENLRVLVSLKNSEGETPLLKLIKYREPTLEILNKFKELGADFNSEDKKGYSVLSWSIMEFRSTETIIRLIELGANVNWKKGWKRQSLLHIAGQYGNVDAMRLLETQFKMNINDRDGSSKTPEEYLKELYEIRGYDFCIEQVNNFCNLTKDRHLSISLENKAIMLEISVKYMNVSAVEHLLKDGADFLKNSDIKCWIVDTLIGYFYLELEPGRKIVKSLINSGIIEVYNNSLIVPTEDGNRFLLHDAVKREKLEFVACLVDEYNQNVNATDDDGNTPLQCLMKEGFWTNLDMANFLLSKEADTTVLDGDGHTLLHLAAACENNNYGVRWCLNLGLDLNAANANGETPFNILASNNWFDLESEDLKSMAIQLCEYGANVFQVDKKGWSVMHYLADSHYMSEEVLNYFLGKGVDINAVDNEGNTPLHIAAHKFSNQSNNDNDGRVNLLLENGADKNMRNKNGKTPYEIGELEILKLN